MAKADKIVKVKKPPERAEKPDKPAAAPHDRDQLAVMVAVGVLVLAFAWVFVTKQMLPGSEAREAEAAVEREEGEILRTFRERAAREGTEILGYESQVFPRVTLVTYVYQPQGSPERKAFWWAYDQVKGSLARVKSVQHFVDEFLLPNVDQLNRDVSGGIPGPLARVRHRDET